MSHELTDLILTSMANQLKAGFDRYGIHNNSGHNGDLPSRWFLVDETYADQTVGYPGDLVEEFTSYEDARTGLFLEIARGLIK